MGEGFYQTNNAVLKFNIDKDLEKIRFNHYICRKENLQRIKATLPRGQFYMAINTAGIDLGITSAKVRGLIKKFSGLDIITNVYKPPKGCKKPSIWQYNSTTVTNSDVHNVSNNDVRNEKHSKVNVFQGITNIEKSNDCSNEVNISKKEKLKENTNTKYNNNIYSSAEHEQIETLWKLYPLKIGKSKAVKLIPKLIKQYSYEELKRTIKRYVEATEKRRKDFKDLKYQNGSTFFNGNYMDYLDGNYLEFEINNKSEAKTNESNRGDSEIYTRQKF